jgi:hypothetical protein
MYLFQCATLEKVQKKTLSEILCVVRSISAAPNERVQRIPVELAELGQRGLTSRHPAFRGNKNRAPPRRSKARWIIGHRRLLRIH